MIGKIKFDIDRIGSLDLDAIRPDVLEARRLLESGGGAGQDFLGWLNLPAGINEDQIEVLTEAGRAIRKEQALVVIGIGGSYLGARAVLEALRPPFSESFPVYFAGHHLDPAYHSNLLAALGGSRYAINVISKSGTTTEPGIAFRLFWGDLKERFGIDGLRNLVFATTDAAKGGLRRLADEIGLKTFVIPDDVGGRFSVLTPVGLLPLAAAGINIGELVAGAREMMELLRTDGNVDLRENPAITYVCFRQAAYRTGKKIEILASYNPSLHYLAEWWKQLYGESEGKDHRGLFPAAVDLTTDLHSLGQWMQEGERIILETVLDFLEGPDLRIPSQESDADGLSYLEGRALHEVNRTALQATLAAHASGGVPCIRLEIPRLDERNIGALLYLFEYSCGISAYTLGVNPFNQPGVEAYKQNMFRMLGRPGWR